MEYRSHVAWRRRQVSFDVKSYHRTHDISFGGGSTITASSAPEFVGNRELPNPEELFTAAISSCFMLTFLYWAAMKGIIINEYQAEALGTLAKNEEGKMAMTEVIIIPSITYHENKIPDENTINELIKKAHENCFISTSVKTKISIKLPTTTEVS